MVKNRKKVILIIVEGDCEEALLYERLRMLYKNHEIRFDIQRGDIFFSFKNKRKPIKNIIGDRVRGYLAERKFKREDILAVLHILDTDGCFISNEDIVINTSQKDLTYYYSDGIGVNSEKQKKHIMDRNEVRSRNIKTMSSTDTILNGSISYKVYYLSRNLEHVLFNEPNPSSDTKLEMVEEYIESLSIPIEEDLSKYIPSLEGSELREKYRSSWKVITQNNASLSRLTNVPLLFQFIEEQTIE